MEWPHNSSDSELFHLNDGAGVAIRTGHPTTVDDHEHQQSPFAHGEPAVARFRRAILGIFGQGLSNSRKAIVQFGKGMTKLSEGFEWCESATLEASDHQ
jgi:hypothetical protein